MRNVVTSCMLVVVAAALPSSLVAQDAIASDRPGIGSGSFVLASGTVQLETGIEYASSSIFTTYSLGQALVRIGAPGFELEILANSYIITDADVGPMAPEEDGLEDLGVGVKLPLVRADGGPLALSLQGLLTAPTGSDGQTADEWIPTLNTLADVGLSDRAGIGVNLGYQAGPGALTDVVTVIVTPSLSLDGGFGAYAGWAAAFSDAGDVHIAEAGLTYLPSPDAQIDINGGWDVDRDDWFIGAGIAVRRGAR